MQPAVTLFFSLVVLALLVWGGYWAYTVLTGKANNKPAPEPNGGNGDEDEDGNEDGNGNEDGGCPDVSDNVLPACEMERRREEAGRTYCPRGVCGEGLEALPDFKTAYMICVPKGQTVEQACP
jgi:hypothetical protein